MNRQLLKRKYRDTTTVLDEDWDNLIILDGCRYDVFKQRNTVSGELTSTISAGSSSWEFVQNNFENREAFDTIYVTSNTHFEKLPARVFYYVEKIYNMNDATKEDYLDRLVEYTIELNKEYPDKRLITHFMQPHAPYFSQKAKKLRNRLVKEKNIRFTSIGAGPDDQTKDVEEVHSLLEACRKGIISDKEMMEVYEKEVGIAVEYVDKLVGTIDGKSVITADHGELIGERVPPLFAKEYDHHNELYCPQLRQVPWLVVDQNERRNITAEDPIEIENIDEETINETLRALGYK